MLRMTFPHLLCHLPKSVSSPEMTLSMTMDINHQYQIHFSILPLKLWWREHFDPPFGDNRPEAIHKCTGLFTCLLIQFVVCHPVDIFNLVLIGDRRILAALQ